MRRKRGGVKIPKTITKNITEVVCSGCGKNFGENNQKNCARATRCEAEHEIKEKQEKCEHKNTRYDCWWEEYTAWFLKETCVDCNKIIRPTIYFNDSDAFDLLTQEQWQTIIDKYNQ